MPSGSDDLVDIINRFGKWSAKLAEHNAYRSITPWEVPLEFVNQLQDILADSANLLSNAPESE